MLHSMILEAVCLAMEHNWRFGDKLILISCSYYADDSVNTVVFVAALLYFVAIIILGKIPKCTQKR